MGLVGQECCEQVFDDQGDQEGLGGEEEFIWVFFMGSVIDSGEDQYEYDVDDDSGKVFYVMILCVWSYDGVFFVVDIGDWFFCGDLCFWYW